jgi:hypothetical protein
MSRLDSRLDVADHQDGASKTGDTSQDHHTKYICR